LVDHRPYRLDPQYPDLVNHRGSLVEVVGVVVREGKSEKVKVKR